LSGNDLGQLGNVERLPDETSINLYCFQSEELQKLLLSTKNNIKKRREALHSLAKSLLNASKVEEAWKVLLSDDELHKED
jgi:hypothetical protein